ncbi:unnamed protein product, partial [Mesorhabditis belari]|uniref:Uncharacterized protein n=1 Tax=Mesorhabditis belari TaxID=2138241 RepID=A0AAF3FCR4_9BILA
MDKTGYRFCEECKGLDIVDRMFHCNGCVFKLCGTCTHRRHRSHETMLIKCRRSFVVFRLVRSASRCSRFFTTNLLMVSTYLRRNLLTNRSTASSANSRLCRSQINLDLHGI